MMDLYKEKRDCCGCTACMSICPNAAISMQPDKEGFLYPQIDANICIDCGLCKKVCAFQGGYNISSNFETPDVYAVKHMDDNIRQKSTSGGAFTAISDYILENKGVVYGAAFDEEFNVVHQRAETSKERDQFKGSKYVQSNLKNIFKKVKEDLANDRWVLFTGTPCQVAGLKSYCTNINTEKLVLCDVICFGTPSNLIWHEHINFLETKFKDKLLKYNFRFRWRGMNVQAKFKHGKILSNTADLLAYQVIYYDCTALRPSCYNCKYANFKRPSDITIGDFWGIEKVMPEFDDEKGVSLVLVSTAKGNNIFERIKNNLIFMESSTIECLQPNLKNPTEQPQKRNEFWKDYFDKGYEYVISKYAGYNYKNRIKDIIKNFMRKTGLLKLAKKILRRR